MYIFFNKTHKLKASSLTGQNFVCLCEQFYETIEHKKENEIMSRNKNIGINDPERSYMNSNTAMTYMKTFSKPDI